MHWVGGQWRVDASGHGFELRARVEPHASLGSWPRSNGTLVFEALEACKRAGAGWHASSAEERSEILNSALSILRENPNGDPQWEQPLGTLFGLDEAELELERRAMAALEIQPRASESEAQIAVVLARWTDLVAGLGQRILSHLELGRSVLVIADERLPFAGDVWCRALEAAQLLPGVVSLVHGVPFDVRRSLKRALAGHQSSTADEAFRATLDVLGVPIVLCQGNAQPANRSVVLADGDFQSAAKMVIEAAFGRAGTISGQLPGRVGRVLCEERMLSAFTEALLKEIALHPDTQNPVPLADARAMGSVKALWELGLDEGCTLIHGGEPMARAGQRKSNDRRVQPAVFTNVESEMQVAQIEDPLPILCLIRIPDQAAGQQLAQQLDR